MDYIDILIRIRKEKKLTQQAVADELNIARSTYSDIEHRKMKLATEDFLKLCEYFEISPSFVKNNGNEINITISKEEAEQLKQLKNIIDKINNQINYSNINNQNITIGNNNSNINFGIINKEKK